MNRFNTIFIVLVFLATVFTNCHVTKREVVQQPAYTGNLLVSFGREIFQRESCQNCHTLHIEEASTKLISLDGFGRKYSSSWIYSYLQEPTSINPNSKKISNRELFSSPLEKKAGSKLYSKSAYMDYENDVQSLQEELRDQNIDVENTEILALIAYLQSIPSSNKQQELDSIAILQLELQQEKWKYDTIETNRNIIEVAENEGNIEAGRLLFAKNCEVCHGKQGQGGIGPNLTDTFWLHGGQKADIANTIIHGVAEKGMISWQHHLSPKQVGELVSFITSLQGSNPEKAKAPQGKKG